MRNFLMLASATFALAAGAAQATTVVDATGDLGQAVRAGGGPTAAADAILRDDLDLTSFSAVFDGTLFLLRATVADTIDLNNDARFVVGINTGGHTQNAAFPTDFFFDKTITISRNGASTASPGVLKFDGDHFSVAVSFASLHAFNTAFAPRDFGFNVWSQAARSTPGPGGAIQRTNVDFAPEHGAISAAPEPASWALMISGCGLAGATLRRRRAQIAVGAGSWQS